MPSKFAFGFSNAVRVKGGSVANKPIKDDVWNHVAENEKYRGMKAGYLASIRYAMRRKLQGLCSYQGCQEKATGYCLKHREYQAMMHRKK